MQTAITMGLNRIRKIDEIAQNQANFYGCDSIEEYCNVYSINYNFLFELCKRKLARFKYNKRR